MQTFPRKGMDQSLLSPQSNKTSFILFYCEEKVANATGGSSGSSPLEETLTDEQIQAKVTEFKTKHPKFAAVVEGISNLDLKETVKA